MSQYLSTHVRQDLFSCLLPFCYQNTPTQAHPARCRLLRFLVFLLGYMLLGLLSLVTEQLLISGPWVRPLHGPSKFLNHFRSLLLDYGHYARHELQLRVFVRWHECGGVWRLGDVSHWGLPGGRRVQTIRSFQISRAPFLPYPLGSGGIILAHIEPHLIGELSSSLILVH